MLVLVAVGTVAFHILSPWWWTEIASNWGIMDTTIIITFWITGVVFIAVVLFMAYCVYRFRYREDRRADYEPENNKLEWWLTVLTTVGVAALLAPGLVAWAQFITVPEDASELEAVGEQWQWSFRLPGKDGILGTTEIKYISDENPFGMNVNDTNGQDDILIEDSEIHIPIDKPVKVLLRSKDVLHDFYVPQFRAKMDIVPGMVTYFWFTPIRTGTFDLMCFELCGVGHHQMRGLVVVESESDYEAWLGEQTTFAQSMARAGTEDGVNLAMNGGGAGPGTREPAR
jgi:cytochrome c oxidase subunit 2